MAKYLTKVSKFRGQYRLTIPKGLIEELKWRGVEFVIMERMGVNVILLGRFIDGESLKSEVTGNKTGSDR